MSSSPPDAGEAHRVILTMRCLPWSSLQSRWCGGRRQLVLHLALRRAGPPAEGPPARALATRGLPDTLSSEPCVSLVRGGGLAESNSSFRQQSFAGYRDKRDTGIPGGGAAGATPLPFARRVPGAQAPVHLAVTCAPAVSQQGRCASPGPPTRQVENAGCSAPARSASALLSACVRRTHDSY